MRKEERKKESSSKSATFKTSHEVASRACCRSETALLSQVSQDISERTFLFVFVFLSH